MNGSNHQIEEIILDLAESKTSNDLTHYSILVLHFLNALKVIIEIIKNKNSRTQHTSANQNSHEG
jgi:hypothetical protein